MNLVFLIAGVITSLIFGWLGYEEALGRDPGDTFKTIIGKIIFLALIMWAVYLVVVGVVGIFTYGIPGFFRMAVYGTP